MKNKSLAVTVGVAILILAGVVGGLASVASAQSSVGQTTRMQFAGMPGIHGTVTAISRNTITLLGRGGLTYTVDASSATFKKSDGKTVTVESLTDIAVSERIFVTGAVTGTSVKATEITECAFVREGIGMGMGFHAGAKQNGRIVSVDGNNVTVERQDGTQFTFDSSSRPAGNVGLGMFGNTRGQGMGMRGMFRAQ